MSGIKLTVLGNRGGYPGLYEACSGYLVETAKTKILLDCGSGVYQKLMQRIKLEELDAIVLSHLHSDHISDALVLRYALQIKKLPKIKLFMPEKPEAESFILKNTNEFDITIIKENEKHKIKDVIMDFAKVRHSVVSYATKIKTATNVVVYSGDTEYTPAIGKFAKYCDLLVCDAAFNEDTYFKGAPHASAKQAAQMAREAEAAKLLLTHFTPGTDTERHLMDAKGEFKFTSLAKPDLTINV
ncbi:MAG: MBL fold metallo-hydrolase [Eubacteriales bacterium]